MIREKTWSLPAAVPVSVVSCVAIASLVAVAVGAPAEFEMTRSAIGGGVMRSSGGEFELSGTVGQPGTGTMKGGEFEVTGGFWFAIPPGDCEDDGDVDLSDHVLFETCLTGPAGAAPGTSCRCFDLDRSGAVDLRDFAAAQSSFTGP